MRCSLMNAQFQSTRPARGATSLRLEYLSLQRCFNPRAPRGARQDEDYCEIKLKEFQSTRPARGATVGRRRVGADEQVSIHAPRAGRDSPAATVPASLTGFNPRAPRGARRDLEGVLQVVRLVSIHAPRAGRDFRKRYWRSTSAWFQSTRPARGATIDFYSIGLDVTSGLIPRTWGNIRMSESGTDFPKSHHAKPQWDAMRANRIGFCGELGVRGGQKMSVSVTSTCSVFPRCSMRFSQLAPRK